MDIQSIIYFMFAAVLLASAIAVVTVGGRHLDYVASGVPRYFIDTGVRRCGDGVVFICGDDAQPKYHSKA